MIYSKSTIATAIPTAQRCWRGFAKPGTIRAWLKKAGHVKANVTYLTIANGFRASRERFTIDA
jgi:hypothetical protein